MKSISLFYNVRNLWKVGIYVLFVFVLYTLLCNTLVTFQVVNLFIRVVPPLEEMIQSQKQRRDFEVP